MRTTYFLLWVDLERKKPSSFRACKRVTWQCHDDDSDGHHCEISFVWLTIVNGYNGEIDTIKMVIPFSTWDWESSSLNTVLTPPWKCCKLKTAIFIFTQVWILSCLLHKNFVFGTESQSKPSRLLRFWEQIPIHIWTQIPLHIKSVCKSGPPEWVGRLQVFGADFFHFGLDLRFSYGERNWN